MVGIDCARHNMKRPNGVGDIQEGEKYGLSCEYSIPLLSLPTGTSMLTISSGNNFVVEKSSCYTFLTTPLASGTRTFANG